MASPFEIRASNVKIEIESVTPNFKTGLVDIQFKAKDPRIANFQLILAQYNIGAGFLDMSLLPNETRDTITVVSLNTDIPAKGEYKSYVIVWDSGEDITLIDHSAVSIKIQGQDSDATADTANTFGSTVAINLLPIISKNPLPIEFLKDTTPELAFEVPGSVYPCNMHFELVISTNSDLSSPVLSLDSSVVQTGWQFQDLGGTYRDFMSPGAPDISALINSARVKYTIQGGDALSLDTYWYEFTVKTATKKLTLDEIDEIGDDLDYYPENIL